MDEFSALQPQENQTPEKAPCARKVNRFWSGCLDLAEEICLAIMIVVLVFTFFFRVVMVTGDSMEQNFSDGDRLIISSMFYHVEPGDVVVITGVLEQAIIKRVIATEGQWVNIDNNTGTVYVDGVALDESAYTENGITTVSESSAMLTFPIQVPDGCVFVLGDNRRISQDSRYRSVGMVNTKNILGKVELRIFPLSEFGRIETN